MPKTRTVAEATAHDSALAHQIGARIRGARKRVGLTQQQLAGDRYTKAYVSALETGIARPSMVALAYLAERLSLPPSHFLDEQSPTWNRLAIDMTLASGDWQAAADGYAALLERGTDDQARAEILRGRAEAWRGSTTVRKRSSQQPRRHACSARSGAFRMRRSPATGWLTASTCLTRRPMRAAC